MFVRCFLASNLPSNLEQRINRHRFRAHMGVRVVSGHSSPCTRFCCSPLYPFSPSTAPAVSPRPIFFAWGLLGPDPARFVQGTFFQVLPLLIITQSHPRTDNLYTKHRASSDSSRRRLPLSAAAAACNCRQQYNPSYKSKQDHHHHHHHPCGLPRPTTRPAAPPARTAVASSSSSAPHSSFSFYPPTC